MFYFHPLKNTSSLSLIGKRSEISISSFEKKIAKKTWTKGTKEAEQPPPSVGSIKGTLKIVV